MPEPVRSADEEAIALGEARYRAGAYGEAAAIFAQVNEQSPSFPTALRLLGLCRLRLGNRPRLLSCSTARDLTPNDPFAQLHYGLGLHEVGRHAEAASLFVLPSYCCRMTRPRRSIWPRRRWRSAIKAKR